MKQETLKKYDYVYDYIANIPKGSVKTYGQVAKACDLKSARLVGKLLHNNPDPENIPCHRVVFADGSLSPAFAFGGQEEHARRLLEEGVVVSGGKVKIL